MVMLWKYNNIKYKIYQGMKQLKRCKIKLVLGEEEEEEEEEGWNLVLKGEKLVRASLVILYRKPKREKTWRDANYDSS
jgi:hypothetical protein